MTPAETAGLTFAEFVEYASALGSPIAAAGIWFFGFHMMRSNTRRADAEQNRHTEAMTALAQAAEDRKAMQAQMAQAAAQAAEDRKQRAADAAADRKAMQEQMTQQAKDAAADRKAMQEQIAQQAKDAAADRKAAQAQATKTTADAAADRKAAQAQSTKTAADAAAAAVAKATTPDREDTKGLLTALKDQGEALKEIIRRTKAPDNVTDLPKRGGKPQPGSAE